MTKIVVLVLIILFVLDGCGEKREENRASGMKCGSGKCGANMFDGTSALARKKKNILSQMRENDPRKDCVIKAKTTKETYDCIRDPKEKKLSLKCGVSQDDSDARPEKKPAMKCGTGKCGGS